MCLGCYNWPAQRHCCALDREREERGINYPAGALSEISLYGYSLFMRLRKYANATWGVGRGAPLLASYLFSTSKRFSFLQKKIIQSFWNEKRSYLDKSAGNVSLLSAGNDGERTKHSGVLLVAPSRESFEPFDWPRAVKMSN
jgi:hypothetical protein